MGFKKRSQTFKGVRGPAVFAPDATEAFMHSHMVLLMPIILVSINLFVIYVGCLFKSFGLTNFLVVSGELFLSHSLPYFPMIPSLKIKLIWWMMIYWNPILSGVTRVIKLLTNISIQLDFQAVYRNNSHIIASCFIHIVRQPMRWSVVSVFDP